MGRATQNIVEIGQRLIDVKARLPHGQFGRWLEDEFGWEHTTAARMMRVASKFGNLPNIDIAPSALYLLASDSKIAEHIGCSRQYVNEVCGHLVKVDKVDRSAVTVSDKRRAVETVLRDEEWGKMPQTKIAEHVGCSQQLVSKLHQKLHLTTGSKIDRSTSTVTRNGSTYEMNTANIE